MVDKSTTIEFLSDPECTETIKRIIRGGITATKLILHGKCPASIYEILCKALKQHFPTIRTIRLENIGYHKATTHYSDMFNCMNYNHVKTLELVNCAFHESKLVEMLQTVKVDSLSLTSVELKQEVQIAIIRFLAKSTIIKEFNLSIKNIGYITLDSPAIFYGEDNPEYREDKWYKKNGFQVECINNRSYRDQRYIDFTNNYTILSSNLDYLKLVISRNVRIREYIREIVLTILMIRKFRSTYLTNIQKDIIVDIAKMIYSHRDDQVYLKECALKIKS